MNKNLVSELVKVANSLDNMGLNKEANSLDKIARKIVVSKVESSSYYKSNILKYKQLIGEKKLPEAYSLKSDVLNSNVLNTNQKAAFEAQASRIINYYDPKAADEPLYTQEYIGKMLKKYKISLSDIKRENLSEDEFNKRWENLKKELSNENQNVYQINFLQQTYDILTAHYKNNA